MRKSVDLLKNCKGDLHLGSDLDHFSLASVGCHHCNFGTLRSGCVRVGFRAFDTRERNAKAMLYHLPANGVRILYASRLADFVYYFKVYGLRAYAGENAICIAFQNF